jgi:hypothetical protein
MGWVAAVPDAILGPEPGRRMIDRRLESVNPDRTLE